MTKRKKSIPLDEPWKTYQKRVNAYYKTSERDRSGIDMSNIMAFLRVEHEKNPIGSFLSDNHGYE